jgi:hypothetical protein
MKSKALVVQPILEMTEKRAERCQVRGRSRSSHARYRALGGLLVLMVVLAGCGGGGYNANNVTVTVAPATATIPANGQMTLQATVNGNCSGCAGSIYAWSVSENNGADCEWFTTQPDGPCPGGTIQETAGGPSSTLTVTYFAPSTSGTYHVVAGWSAGFGAPVSKDGTSVITVSP